MLLGQNSGKATDDLEDLALGDTCHCVMLSSYPHFHNSARLAIELVMLRRWKTGCSKLEGQAAQLETVQQGSQPQLRRIPQAPCSKQLLASHRWHKQVHFYAHTKAFLCGVNISSFSAGIGCCSLN